MALIDDLQAETFHDRGGLRFITDKYALRTVLRKAHCFVLDEGTSRLTTDFSMAIAHDLDEARHLAVPPFPVTWFDIDNAARLQRTRELGISLTKNAATNPVQRVGWLIEQHPQQQTAYRMTYAVNTEKQVIVAPLSFGWDTAGFPSPWIATDSTPHDLDVGFAVFGVPNTGVRGIWLGHPPGSDGISRDPREKAVVVELMREVTGELRHIFGLLIALGHGVQVDTGPARPLSAPVQIKGKTLLPLEHKTLVIHLKKKQTPESTVARAITGIKHRWHEVRSHLRTYKNPDGTVKYRKIIAAHARGDEKLGRIEKTYRVKT